MMMRIHDDSVGDQVIMIVVNNVYDNTLMMNVKIVSIKMDAIVHTEVIVAKTFSKKESIIVSCS